jgi:uncharacterized protein YndB with AHSA1/START domain
MTDRSVTHTTFVIERTYPVSPPAVFAAFAEPALKERWFTMPPNWVDTQHTLDFRVGGRESNRGGPAGGPVHLFDARYQDIVENERIVYAYDLYIDEQRVSVSLATVELAGVGSGTRMTFTEQGGVPRRVGGPGGAGARHQPHGRRPRRGTRVQAR